MAILTEDMQRIVREQRLGFWATVCADGSPNLSPKGTTSVWDDDHLFFAGIRSPTTIENIRRGSIVEVNVVDPFVRKGYRFKGPAADFGPTTAEYEKGLHRLAEAGILMEPGRISQVVVMAVVEVNELISPSYDSGANEAELSFRWEKHFARLLNLRRSPAED